MEIRLAIFLSKSGHKESDEYNLFLEAFFMGKKRSQYNNDYKIEIVCLIVEEGRPFF